MQEEAAERVGVADVGAAAVEMVETLMQLLDAEVSVGHRLLADRIELSIDGPGAAWVVGRRGQTLDALQYLLNRMLTQRLGEHPLVVVNADGYRERREASLVELAHRLSEKAQQEGKVVALNPMTARDRRVVHMALRDVAGVSTRSEGDGEERRLLIVPEVYAGSGYAAEGGAA